MRLQPIYDIAEICARQGISQAVLCPGSRCAPLTLAFTHHKKIKCRTISDERSAGFIALGISQQTQSPAVLICTSGSAVYNFAPATAEAFFQQLPLVILTADRPKEWIDQFDGQTIRQENIFGRHVKKSYSLPEDFTHPDSIWYLNRVVNEAILLAQEFPAGPVHINVPLREPLYPAADEKISFSKSVRIISKTANQVVPEPTEVRSLASELAKTQKVLMVVGQHESHEGTLKAIEKFCQVNKVALLGDVISNLHGLSTATQRVDTFLGQCPDSLKLALKPDLLITVGKSILSKHLKLFLRKHQPKNHWHIQPAGEVADTYQQLTTHITSEPGYFFEALSTQLIPEPFDLQKKENYARLWKAEEHRMDLALQSFFSKQTFGEFKCLQEVLKQLPDRCNLHLANSMAVRYVNLLGLAKRKGIRVYANRGTSGIDGCTSTAVGHSLTSDVLNILITGDLAFFYDRNAFWHNYPLPNLRIVVINNQGGIIFNLIDGPGTSTEKDEYFVTRQKLTAASLATEFGIPYYGIDSERKLKSSLGPFLQFDSQPKILEILSDQKSAVSTFNQFKKHIQSSYEA